MIPTLSTRPVALAAAITMLLPYLGVRHVLAAGVVPATPSIPARTHSILDEGAAADGKALSTAAIQQAINKAAAEGGGRVLVPPGTFVSGPVRLKSNVDLHLARGATLRMSPNVDDFPADRNNRESFITAADAHDVQISGDGGIIDGQGKPWWDAFRKVKGAPDAGPRRPQMIRLTKCERVRLTGFATLNPPNTHCSMSDCTDVTIEGLTMTAPDDSPNTDALNLRVRNAVVRKCRIATGDDNIVLLAGGRANGTDAGVENVAIADCELGVGHGLSIGSYTSGGVRNVTVENVVFDGTTAGIRMKAGRDRGGLVEHISFKNVAMRNVKHPIWLSSYYPKEPKSPGDDKGAAAGATTPRWQHISIENLTATGATNAAKIWGLPEQPIMDVSLKNVRITAERGAAVYNAKGVKFANVQFDLRGGPLQTTENADVESTAVAAPKPDGTKTLTE